MSILPHCDYISEYFQTQDQVYQLTLQINGKSAEFYWKLSKLNCSLSNNDRLNKSNYDYRDRDSLLTFKDGELTDGLEFTEKSFKKSLKNDATLINRKNNNIDSNITELITKRKKELIKKNPILMFGGGFKNKKQLIELQTIYKELIFLQIDLLKLKNQLLTMKI